MSTVKTRIHTLYYEGMYFRSKAAYKKFLATKTNLIRTGTAKKVA